MKNIFSKKEVELLMKPVMKSSEVSLDGTALYNPQYESPKFQERLGLKKEDTFPIYITAYRLIELVIVAFTQGILDLSDENRIPEKENTFLAHTFRSIMNGIEYETLSLKFNQAVHDKRIQGRNLVELCLIIESCNSIFFGIAVQKMLNIMSLAMQAIPDSNSFLFYLYDMIVVKHNYSIFIPMRLKKV